MSMSIRLLLLSTLTLLGLGTTVIFLGNRVTTPAVVSVQPGQEAVVFEGENVVEVLGPGVHRVDQQRYGVATYQTMLERTYEMPDPLPVAGCPASVAIYYNVQDVAAFNQAGGDANVGANSGTEVRRLASEFSDFGDDPRTEMQVYLRTQMGAALFNGMAIIALIVKQEGCEPDL